MSGGEHRIIPFYLVVDVSASMHGPKLDNANKILPQLYNAAAKSPILADIVRFGLIDFADTPTVVMPLSNVLERETFPLLEDRGGTYYSSAFRLLKDEIDRDVRQLKADNFAVHRPAVFFLSDGEPLEDPEEWREAFRELTYYDAATGAGNSYYPNVIPMGVDGADARTLAELIHPRNQSKMYLHDKGADAGRAISDMADVLLSSVLMSATGAAKGGSGIQHPEPEQLPDGVVGHEASDFL